jgi:Cupin
VVGMLGMAIKEAEAGDPSFQNNVPDPILAGEELPTFKFELEKSERDVGYIPQGYGHSIENVGSNACRVLIGFNTGVYETIDLSQWIARNPLDVLATNFSKPAALFEKFPQGDVFIADKNGA